MGVAAMAHGIATVGMVWKAHDTVMHARTEEWGTVGTGMAIRGVEASFSKTYMQEEHSGDAPHIKNRRWSSSGASRSRPCEKGEYRQPTI